MNGAFIGFGAAAIITAAAIISTPQPSPGSPAVFEAPAARAAAVDTLNSVTLRVSPEMSARQIIKAIADTDQLAVSVDWNSIAEAGMKPDEPVGISGERVTAYQILTEFSNRYDDAWNGIDWRLEGKLLTIDRKVVFSMRERILACYDIEPVIEKMLDHYHVSYEWATAEIGSVIQELIEPDQWQANGGDLAQLRIVSGRMFVNAPLRTHEKVAWVLQELSRGSAEPMSGAQGHASEPNVMPQPTDEERAHHAMSQLAMSQLRNIHMAVQIWGQANEAPLTSIQQLIEGGMLKPGAEKSAAGPAPDGRDYWIDFDAILKSDAEGDWAKRVVGIDRAMFAQGKEVAVLFLDGHIELMPITKLHTLLVSPVNQGVKPDLPSLK